MEKITIVSCGLGNVGSVRNMFRQLDCDVVVSADPAEISRADKIILPGVGAFDAGMEALCSLGVDEAVHTAVTRNNAYLLGICLGMQMLVESSEEGHKAGLRFVPGRARRFVPDGDLRVPHMGWNVVRPARNSTLLDLGAEEQRFYFVHSYFVECSDPRDVAGLTTYGDEFVSVLERGRVLGVQFHAEKSHRFGMALFRRFIAA